MRKPCHEDTWEQSIDACAALTANLLVCPVETAKQTCPLSKVQELPISNFVSCFCPLYFWHAAVEAEQQLL